MSLLDVRNLRVDIPDADGRMQPILHGVDCTIERGEILGVVGGSGSGKTMLMRALLDILPRTARRRWDHCTLDGRELAAGAPNPRGLPVAMIFQDPMTSLDPVRTVGFHLTEVIGRWQRIRGREAKRLAVETLDRVGIDDPSRRFRQYPHELSGGMRQRVMIAMALLVRPVLLIADEPTTALDVTVQAQILDLIASLREDEGLAVALVTHDFGVVAGLCDRVAVMQEGHVVEEATVDALFSDPQHDYTRALLAAMPGAR